MQRPDDDLDYKARLPEIQSGLDEYNEEAIELSNTISHNLSKLIQ